MTGCLQWLDATGTKGGGSCPDRGCQKPSGSLVRKHGGREQKSPPGGPGGAPPRLASGKDTPRSVSSGRAGRSRGLANPCVSRRSAPPSSAEARRAKADRAGDKGMTAFPGPIKNTGDGARLRLSLPSQGRITKEHAPHARIATIPAPVGRHLLLLYHRLTGRRGTAPLPCGCHILWLTICQWGPAASGSTAFE